MSRGSGRGGRSFLISDGLYWKLAVVVGVVSVAVVVEEGWVDR